MTLWTFYTDTLHGRTIRPFFVLRNSIHVFSHETLPVIAPAWLPALLKISVQILYAPEGRKIPKFMNDQNESKIQQTGKKLRQADRKLFLFCVPFVTDPRAPEIAVPVRSTG